MRPSEFQAMINAFPKVAQSRSTQSNSRVTARESRDKSLEATFTRPETQPKAHAMGDIAARCKAISQAKDTIFTQQTPEQHALQQQQNLAELVAIRTIMEVKILDAMPAQDGDGVGLEELAAKTKSQVSLLERLLRFLVGTRFFVQDENGKYRHSRISQGYLNGRAGAFFSGSIYGPVPCLEGIISLPTSYLALHGEPDSPSQNPTLARLHKLGQNVWSVLAQDFPQQTKEFHDGLAMVTIEKFPNYDFSGLVLNPGETAEEKDRVVLVDVGSGAGQVTQDILEAHKAIDPARCVIQDQEQVLAHAPISKVKKMPHDFFTPQPVKRAKAYLLRMILHDYSDPLAVDIMKQIVPAMAPDSKILLNEAIMPERVTEETLSAAAFDIVIMTIGGRERTMKRWEQVLKEAGLGIQNVWQEEGAGMAVIEAVLA